MRLCWCCGDPLPKGRRRYCSDDCGQVYFEVCIAPLWWVNARKLALKRANYRCEACGTQDTKLEVHHINKLVDSSWNSSEGYKRGDARWNSPKNAQENLQVLCRACHEKAHHPMKPRPTLERIKEAQGVGQLVFEELL